MLGGAASKYFSLLNKQAASSVLKGTRATFRGSMHMGKWGAAKNAAHAFRGGAGQYFWSGANAAQRTARIGTVTGAALLGSNFVNPRNNFGPF